MSTTTQPAKRVSELDVLRGIALVGILPVNIYQQLIVPDGASNSFPLAVEVFFFDRFLPIFAVLFGIGFGLFLKSAAARVKSPRVVLARRLVFLLLLGALHFVLQPGEVLTAYAVFGLLVLLPVSYLKPRNALLVGLVLFVIGSQIVNGYGPIPGLLVLGFALSGLGVPSAISQRSRYVDVVFAVSAPLAVFWAVSLINGFEPPVVNFVGGLGGGTGLLVPLAGAVTALAYVIGILLLLRTPIGASLSRFFSPMGRMALTNYISATVLFLLGGAALSIDGFDDAPKVVLLTAVIVVLQIVLSRKWLQSYRYGPLEWLWRCATWAHKVPIKKTATMQDPAS